MPFSVIVGRESSTITVLKAVCVLLLSSVELYVTVYVPGIAVFTGSVVLIVGVKSPHTISYAVAPSSS